MSIEGTNSLIILMLLADRKKWQKSDACRCVSSLDRILLIELITYAVIWPVKQVHHMNIARGWCDVIWC